MYKRVPAETRAQILEKVKNGQSVTDLATQYAISPKTICNWLQNQTRPEVSILEYNRLKKENKELKRIIGMVTLELERGKKIVIIKTTHNKKLIATCMNVNHKNIYYESLKKSEDDAVKDTIETTFKTHPAYGHRRLALELEINKKKILRIMHKYGLKAPRLWYQKRFTTQSDTDCQMKYTNVLKDAAMDEYGMYDVWSSYLTYIEYQGKFVYLAIIQDIASKEIIGFNMSDKHIADLVLKTLKEAVVYTKKLPKIFHSDRGREYLSATCTSFLENIKIAVSVSDPGSPWQNSWSESFFSRFKNESGNLNRFDTLGELIEHIFGYIRYYNNKRIHTTIKMSPYQFKQKILESVLEKRGYLTNMFFHDIIL